MYREINQISFNCAPKECASSYNYQRLFKMTELIKRCICRRSQLKTRCEHSHIRHPCDMRLPPTVVSLPNALQGDRVFRSEIRKKSGRILFFQCLAYGTCIRRNLLLKFHPGMTRQFCISIHLFVFE